MAMHTYKVDVRMPYGDGSESVGRYIIKAANLNNLRKRLIKKMKVNRWAEIDLVTKEGKTHLGLLANTFQGPEWRPVKKGHIADHWVMVYPKSGRTGPVVRRV